jgi:hypothetical protein
MKSLAAIAAVSGLMVSTALAQAPSPSTETSPPAAMQPAPGGTGAPRFVSSQKPDQWLASRFKGTDVLGADDKKIGDVSDILFGKDGRIEAYVVSVGGFLGMGAKNVALAPDAFQVMPGSNGDTKLKVNLTEEQVKNAAAFEPYSPPRATTGTGGTQRGGERPRPGPGGM